MNVTDLQFGTEPILRSAYLISPHTLPEKNRLVNIV